MTLTDLLISQLLDPFRIVLLVALVLTARNTAATVGIAVPIALGIVFVAVLLPATTQTSAEVAKTTAILSGLVINAVVVLVLLAALGAWKRGTGSS